ncbi:hypothetical protein BDZ89DRAFT_1139223 [Hymenopellis radicata]|nr:hypothetical protein BDZ89DRAFT_1139223 [Hymenopellis radicata]
MISHWSSTLLLAPTAAGAPCPWSFIIHTSPHTPASILPLALDVYNRCKDFVRMCGLDPDTATAEDMDGVDMFFQCEECDSRRISPPGTRLFGLMRWRTAMNHQHLGMMSRVEDADLIASGRRQENRLLEKDLLSKPAGHAEFSQAFVCVHCDMPEASRTARAGIFKMQGEVKIAIIIGEA